MQIRTLSEEFALARLSARAAVPEWVAGQDLIAVVRTRDELSIVCRSDAIPASVDDVVRGFRGLAVVGTLDFGLTGVIAGLTKPLAEAGIALFSISTFDTGYMLVSGDKLDAAKTALARAGYDVLP